MTKNIKFFDLSTQYKNISSEINESINNVCNDSSYASGKYVEKFENEFADHCHGKYCVGVNSGTSALHLALLANGVDEDDEVITVSHTFISTSWSITYCKAKPVFVDVNDDDKLINVSEIEKLINNKTKAILPVHYGNPANMNIINKIAKKHNLNVVEDATSSFSNL